MSVAKLTSISPRSKTKNVLTKNNEKSIDVVVKKKRTENKYEDNQNRSKNTHNNKFTESLNKNSEDV